MRRAVCTLGAATASASAEPRTEPRRLEVYPTGRWPGPGLCGVWGGAEAGAGPSSGKGETETRLNTPLLQPAPMDDRPPI